MEMAWIVDIVGIVGMGMVADIVVGIIEGIFVEVVGFRNYIPSKHVQVGFDIVVEANLVMEFGYSKSFEDDSNSFVEGIVEESLAAKAFLVPHNRKLLLLVLLPLDSFSILSTLGNFVLNDFLYKDHTREHYPKDIPLMHVSFYIWNKRLIKLVLVLLSSYLLSKHLLEFLIYLGYHF